MKMLKQYKSIKTMRRAWIGLGAALYLAAESAFAALPSSAQDVLPDGVAADGPVGGTMLAVVSWALQALAYLTMIVAVVGAGYFIFKSFGEASDTKGGWGKFGGVAIGSIIMVAVVVTLGLIAVNWAQGLATVTVGTTGGA